MYSLIFKNFIRSQTVRFSLFLILAVGVTGIFIGKQFLQKQEKSIAAANTFQREHIQRNVNFHSNDMGLLLYYLRFSLINKPDKLAALSIGQRDINPAIQAVTIRGLEAQKYDTDLSNPSNLLSGNLDLGFVIIYLFPLVIIAFTFNFFSEEIEGGTWRLVAAQSKSMLKFLFNKLFTRVFMLYITLAVLFVIAIVVLSLQINEALLAFASLSVLYLAFWIALSFWIASFKKSSSFNALTLLSVWVLLAILLPAAANNFFANKYPVPEALSTMVKQRDAFHEKWDVEKAATMNKFYAHYPQYRKYPSTGKTFNWLWYYAMQQMGDDESLQYREEMRRKIALREAASHAFALAVPTMHTQLLFNDITQTGLRNHLQFLDSTDRFHEKMRLYFYPKIFENASAKDEDWNRFRPEYFSVNGDVNWLKAVSPLLIITTIISLLAVINLKKI